MTVPEVVLRVEERSRETLVGMGFLIHWMIPAMPLPVAFALAAIVSPTDAVAVSAITARVASIFTNVALTADREPWWEEIGSGTPTIDWQWRPYDPKNGPAAHPNSRFNVGAHLSKPPKIFHVNWFRRDASGKFLWPGYGENLRVLAWILERCAGRAGAFDSAIGYLPRTRDIGEYLDGFGNRLPARLRDAAAEVAKRLGA